MCHLLRSLKLKNTSNMLYRQKQMNTQVLTQQQVW
ncbi:hypothetical protein pdam_00021803 [Pocillopora damicornis]|uniref:Uncharacterized protein n=1 Tax=Pocillopora damicornis TaxID=46731 RepID=A0A3M6UNX2_POCDA|nr:hypothetical protein pdam_00021803 [Pocillopora damicornis]